VEAVVGGVLAERVHDLLARRGERALRQVLADQVDGSDERLGLQRQQARRPREVVAVRLGVHLDLVALHLGVEHVRAAAEVHDVQHVDVLAQLLVGDLERLAERRHVELAPLARGVDQDAGERDEPGEALRADRRLAPLLVVLGLGLLAAAGGLGELGRLGVALGDEVEPLACLRDELLRALDARLLAEAEHPRHHLAGVRVVGLEDHAAVRVRDLACVPEVPQREPVDPVGEPDARAPHGIAELPVGARGVHARVEVLGAAEVVLGLRRVADLAADARDAEDAHVVALVGVADQVELPAAVEQVVRIHLALLLSVAADRVVLEDDRLAAEDRRLDLREPLRELAPARARGDRERHAALLGSVERRRLPPGELLKREPKRLGVGELAVEQRERRAQRPELLVGELDRRQVEVLRRKRVVLRLVVALGRLVDLQVDAERLQLRAVGVEAPGEGLVVHLRVALDVLLDLERRDRPSLRHQERDQ
jgi:hypothetical protein